jgi:hypothetical protein
MDYFVGNTLESHAIERVPLEQILDDFELARVNRIMFISCDPWGCAFEPHEERYAFTRLKPRRLPAAAELGDCLGMVCEAAARRKMRVYAHNLAYESAWDGYWPALRKEDCSDISSRVLANFTACCQIDLFGRKNFRVCMNHPDYRQYLLSIAEDQLRSYPIEGIKLNVERNGPLSSVLVGNYAATFHTRKPQAPACFCAHCLKLAAERGINLERARQGWLELLNLSETSFRQARERGDAFAGEGPCLGDSTAKTPPADGYFITFLRIIMRFPEILQHNQLYYDSIKSLYGEMYGIVKMVHPDRKLGLHVWTHRAFSIFERAMWDYAELRRYADWIKPKIDHTTAGFRFHQDVRRYTQALFQDRSAESAYRAFCTMLGWEEEGPYDELPTRGMSLDYVRRDVEMAVEAVRDEVPIYPGIGINIPAPTLTSTPESVAAAIAAAHAGGARGIMLTRNYLEQQRENLIAAGEAIDRIKRSLSAV